MAELAVPKYVRSAGVVVVVITSVLVALSAAPAFAATVTAPRDLGQCNSRFGAGGVDGRLDSRRREREL